MPLGKRWPNAHASYCTFSFLFFFQFPLSSFPQCLPYPTSPLLQMQPLYTSEKIRSLKDIIQTGITSYNKTMSTGQTPLSSQSSRGLDH